MPEFKKFLCLVIFLFQLILFSNNDVLEPETGHFRGLVGSEAKDFKMCLRGQGRPRELHLWCLQQRVLNGSEKAIEGDFIHSGSFVSISNIKF